MCETEQQRQAENLQNYLSLTKFTYMTNPDGSVPAQQTGGYGGGDWISSLINLGSAIYASEVSRKNTKDTIAANKEQAEYAYSKDLEMWNRQNAYNDPLAQMLRMRQAGLNPNMVYGGGSSGAGGQAAQMPRYNAPTLNYAYNPIDFTSVIGMYQDFRIKQATLNNLKAQEENIRARTVSEASRNTLLGAQGEIAQTKAWTTEYQAPYQNAIVHNQAQASEAKLRQEWQKVQLMNQEEIQRNLSMEYMKKRMTLSDIEAEKKQAETLFLDMRNEWMKMGVTTSDNMLIRVMVRMMNESGIGPEIFKVQKGPNWPK